MDLTKLAQAHATKINEAKALSAPFAGKEHEMPQETMDKITGILGEADNLKVKIDLAKRMSDGEKFSKEPDEDKQGGIFHGWRDVGPNEGNAPYDEKSYVEVKYMTAYGEATHRVHTPICTQKKEYRPAFEAYLRFGVAGVKERYPKDWKTLSEGTDTAGGFLVPVDLQTSIIRKQMAMTAVRPNARKITTGKDRVQWPRRTYNTDDKWTSAARVTWTGELPASATTHRITDNVYGLSDIPVHMAMASAPISNSLLEDNAYDVEGDIAMVLAEAHALGEDTAFISGSGVAQPYGLTTTIDATNYISSVVSGTTSTLTADGLIDLYFGVPAQYRANSKWIMNSGTMKIVEKLKDEQSRYLVQSLVNGSLASPVFDTIKGKPVSIDEFMPDVAADAYPILYGDLAGYLIVDRVGYSVQRLTELYAETDITLFLSRQRVGGQVIEPWKMRVQKVAAS
jgi:HK97 family phage major capsid protein